MLSYYVLHDVVSNLDERYQDQLNSYDRIFYCANYIKMLGFYNIFSLKQSPYNLREKVENQKQKELINFFIKTIKEENYHESIILMAYGLIVNKAINDISKPYFSSLVGAKSDIRTHKRKQKLQRIISYHLRDIFTEQNKDFKKIPSTFNATAMELQTITKLFSDVYKFSNTKNIILKCQDNLERYYNQNINFLLFKKIRYNFLDKHSKSRTAVRPCLKTGLMKKRVDYLNMKKRPWMNPYTDRYDNSSFMDIYDKIVEEASTRIKHFNSLVFYSERTGKILKKYDYVVLNTKFENPIFSKLTKFKK